MVDRLPPKESTNEYTRRAYYQLYNYHFSFCFWHFNLRKLNANGKIKIRMTNAIK